MAKITGIPGLCARRPDGTPPGRFVGEPNAMTVAAKDMPVSTIECPYCHELLRIFTECGGRAIWVDENAPGDILPLLVDPLPPTHIALHCRTCKVSFSTLVGG